MEISDDYKRIIDEDISRCEAEYNNGTRASRHDLYMLLCAKYAAVINDFSKHLFDMFSDDNGEKCRKNINILRERLILFKAMGYKNQSDDSSAGIVVNNTLSSSVTITVDDTRSSIANMSALTQTEINEAMDKLDEIQQILESNERKSQKWERAKDIIKWVADKGVDVGIAFLPLLLQIGGK